MKDDLIKLCITVGTFLITELSGSWIVMFVLGGLTTYHPSYSQVLGLFFVFVTLVDTAHLVWDVRKEK